MKPTRRKTKSNTLLYVILAAAGVGAWLLFSSFKRANFIPPDPGNEPLSPGLPRSDPRGDPGSDPQVDPQVDPPTPGNKKSPKPKTDSPITGFQRDIPFLL